MNSEVLIHQNPDGNIKTAIRLENETVWLTQEQMALLLVKPSPPSTSTFKIFIRKESLTRKVLYKNSEIPNFSKRQKMSSF